MNLVFAHPWLFALVPLPWLLRAALPARRRPAVAVRVPFAERIRDAAGAGPAPAQIARGIKSWCIPVLLWLLVLGALARPQWLEPALTRTVPARDLLLLVDLSGSMQHEDFTNQAGAKVDRLTAVKEVLGDFLTRREGDRVGLVVFGDAPFLQAPFSTDLTLARRLLEETAIGMAGPRTAFGDAIGLGVNLFEGSEVPAKTIIALTDGNDTKSQVPPAEAARVAAQRDIRIHTVAIGDPTTVGEEKLDEAALREVAAAAGGNYYFAADRKALAGIYGELDKVETREVNTASHRPRRDLFPWVLLAALVLSLTEKFVRCRMPRRAGAHATPAAVRVNPLTGELGVTA